VIGYLAIQWASKKEFISEPETVLLKSIILSNQMLSSLSNFLPGIIKAITAAG